MDEPGRFGLELGLRLRTCQVGRPVKILFV
jgi:hypothetical protein